MSGELTNACYKKPPIDKTAVGKRIANTRKLKGFSSQDKFAEAVGISSAALGYYETGKRSPDYETFAKIASTLKVSYEYLLGETDSMVRENIDIAKTLGLSDKAIQQLKASKKAAKSLNSEQLDICKILNIFLENEDFCAALFDNSRAFLSPRARDKAFSIMIDNDTDTYGSDDGDLYLLRICNAFRLLWQELKKGGNDNG